MANLNRPFIIKAVAVALAAYAILQTLTVLLLVLISGQPISAYPASAFLVVLFAPIWIAGAWGLFKRKAWARIAAVIGLVLIALQILLSLPSIGVIDILWLAFTAFMIFLFLTDEGIRLELSR